MSFTIPVAPATTNNRAVLRFCGIALAVYLAWIFGYEHWLSPDGRLDSVLCAQITKASVVVLRALGFAATASTGTAHSVVMNGQTAVNVWPPCNGLVMYTLFTGFVLAFPGPVLRKLWFIPTGIALIWCLNVLRVAALAVNHHYAHQSVEFNHHYTFNFVVYSCIFGLWMLWARRLALPAARLPLVARLSAQPN